MSHPTETISKDQSSSAKASADLLWQAISKLISLQNQAPPLVNVARDRDLPLSCTQERLWVIDQLASGSSAYNIPLVLRLKGVLNIPALEQSLQAIIQRHEALRTSFTSSDNHPVQIIPPETTWSLTRQKLEALKQEELEAQIQQIVAEEVQRPFDLTSDNLFRASLIELNSQENILLITVHHIVFDGWSEGLFWRELASLYQSFSQGEPSSLPDLPIQYVDFAVWQRNCLQGDFLKTLLDYWQQQLGTNLTELKLPTDYPQPQVPTRRSAHYQLVFSPELTAAIKDLSRQSGATLFATLLTTFKILLHRYTEQEQLFVCSPIANRNRPELKNLMGYFVNLLILPIDLAGNPSFRELLSQVKQTVSGAYAHQDLPLQQLINHLDMGQTPVSQVMFVLQNTNQAQPSLSGLTVEKLEVDNGTADFDLSLSVTELSETLVGTWKYNTDLFAPETISTMARHWQQVLEEVVTNADRSLADLLVFSPAEIRQLAAKKRARKKTN